jgi:hypothetical protein
LDYANYLNTLSTTQLEELKGTSFWGTSGLSEGTSKSINECKAMCASNSKCSGATFNPDKKYCWLRKGDGPIMPSSSNDYSIIPENIKYLNLIKITNQKLMDLNQQILGIINNNISLYNKQSTGRNVNYKTLNDNYYSLLNERNKIQKEIQKFEELNEQQNESSIHITKNYSFYFILLAIAIFCVYILFKITNYGQIVIDTSNKLIESGNNFN